MTDPRMDDERIAEALVAIHNAQTRLPSCPPTFEHANPSEIAYIAEFLPDALHDLEDARKRVAELEGALEVAQFEVVELVWVTDSSSWCARNAERNCHERQADNRAR